MLFSLKIHNWPICFCSQALDYQIVPSHYHSGLGWCCVLQQGQSSWSQFSRQHFVSLWGSVSVHGGHVHALSSSGVSLLIFLPTCFSASTVVLALNSQAHGLSLYFCIWPSLDTLGPAKAKETPALHVPPASCEYSWCSALGVVASSAHGGELPWTSYASGDSSCRAGNLQETLPTVSLLSPFFPFPKVMLFSAGEKDAACLGHWAVCSRAKNAPVPISKRKSHRAKFRSWM